MRVAITHRAVQRGFLMFKRNYYQVIVSVQFSAEERFFLDNKEHHRNVVMRRNPSAGYGRKYDNRPDYWHLRVLDLLHDLDEAKPYFLATPAEAIVYEEALKKALQSLRYYIDANAGYGNSRLTFEL